MKKKNGFTLIELLAFIIILGILMIIAIPSVTKYISDSRKNAYVDTANGQFGSCNWLLENLGQYENHSGAYGYWLDTPYSSNSTIVLSISASSLYIGDSVANNDRFDGVRPVITIKTEYIEQ